MFDLLSEVRGDLQADVLAVSLAELGREFPDANRLPAISLKQGTSTSLTSLLRLHARSGLKPTLSMSLTQV